MKTCTLLMTSMLLGAMTTACVPYHHGVKYGYGYQPGTRGYYSQAYGAYDRGPRPYAYRNRYRYRNRYERCDVY